MRISVAPYMSIILDMSPDDMPFQNLSLLNLPNYVTVYVAGKWDELLMESKHIIESYELFRLLLELPVVELEPNGREKYIMTDPEILIKCSDRDQRSVRTQLYGLCFQKYARRIFAGVNEDVGCFKVFYDKTVQTIWNFNPYGAVSLSDLIVSYLPKLEQLKHSHENRMIGNKEISPFSAYDRYDSSYAEELLLTAYVDHKGDVDDRTYLYTYDKKNKTFVEFRPGRNGIYHGMDINLAEARKKAPAIVKKFHK